MKLNAIAAGLALAGLTLALPAAAAPALTSATLDKIGLLIGAQPSANGFSSGQFAALQPLAPSDPTACAAPLSAAGNGRKLWAMYMIGTDLESRNGFATTNLDQLVEGWKALGMPADADIIVAFGGSDKDGWRGVKYATMAQILADSADGQYGNSGNYLFSDDQANMGDQATFTAFLNYVNSHYGQDSRRFLSFWNHGASFNDEPGIGPDQNHKTILDDSKINLALAQTNSCFHLIGFDACLMASMETARAIKDFGGYMLASEELEPGHGWNYSHFLSDWLTQPDVPSAGSAMVDHFIDSTAHAYQSTGKTLSLVNLGKYDTTIATVANAGSLLAGVLSSGQESQPIIQAFANSERYAGNFTVDPSVIPSQLSIDLVDFMGLVRSRTTDAALQTALDSATAAVKGMVVHAANDGSRPYSNGIAIAPLDMNPTYAAEQVQTGLIDSGWGSLIAAWSQAQKSATAAPVPTAFAAGVPGAGLSFLDRWGQGVALPEVANSLGVTGGFSSPWLSEVKATFGSLSNDGSLTVLGEMPTYPTVGGSFYAEQWNGAAVFLQDGNTVMPVPLFLNTTGGQQNWAGVAYLGRVATGKAMPYMMMVEEQQDGSLAYGLAPIYETTSGGWVLGRVDQAGIQPGDIASFSTFKFQPNGQVEIISSEPHTFSGEPTLGTAPLTQGNYAYTLAGYTIADSGAIGQAIPVAEADRVFNWAQVTYGNIVKVEDQSQYLGGYYGRCDQGYSQCVAVKDGDAWYWDGSQLSPLGPLGNWFSQAQAAGY